MFDFFFSSGLLSFSFSSLKDGMGGTRSGTVSQPTVCRRSRPVPRFATAISSPIFRGGDFYEKLRSRGGGEEGKRADIVLNFSLTL